MSRSWSMVLAVLVVVSGIGPAEAQSPDFDQARNELQAGRDQIIREELRLSAEQQAEFWPIYRAYVARLAPLRDRKAELVGRFIAAYEAGQIDEELAEWLIEENFAIKEAWLGVQREFQGGFRTVLPVQEVARFYQLENKMDAEVDAQLAQAVPLIE
ncbi:MAG: hypothetical protein QNJ23_08300 [Woeseiaceae bacterium]|nr:hypothetical protein [Woeseiaceae bacterium]